ncbi:hypothetical protein [Zunongwangia atlantica]|uniref:O-antigen polymerase n=1 Tax=Zunongwangia atlantica 22II14-10F7 TaxID=1185767 RepID=A0A1Y1SZF8_9FLAO|nr:hypothetical protein [Zunongwangia atlantica]ORL43735.1 hypothetical protein IIF7_19279 [Zunongwangia atlantica 22II14-10F7]
MGKKKTRFLISSNILLLLWISVDAFSSKILNTTLVWILGFFIYYVFVKGVKYKNEDLKALPVKIYLFWLLGTCLYGILQSQIYWDYKNLIYNSFALFLPIVVFVLSNIMILQKVIRNYVVYGFPFFFVFALIAPNNVYGYYLAPVTLFLLFFKSFSTKYKLYMLIMVIVVFMSTLGARTTIVSFIFSILLVFFSYLKLLHKKWVFNSARLLLLISPFILFSLAVTGVFNIFKIEENTATELKQQTRKSNGELVEENLLADTRTLLYKEVLISAYRNEYWLYGRSPARGNDTAYFVDESLEEGRNERNRNEIGVANIFTWTGLIGVILYFIIFWKASFLAINKSNNDIVKIIGIYVCYRWFNSWIAEINMFDLINLTIWMAVAICFSPSFRRMTNNEVKIWVKGITEKKYNFYFLQEKTNK